MAYPGKKILRLNLDRSLWGLTIRRRDRVTDPLFTPPPCQDLTLTYLRQFIPHPEKLGWKPAEEQVGLRCEYQAEQGDYLISLVFPDKSKFFSAEGVIAAFNKIFRTNDSSFIQEVGAMSFPSCSGTVLKGSA